MSDLLTADDRRRVLGEARRAVTEALEGGRPAPPAADGVFGLHAGVFVSLHRHGGLRGCIGQPYGERPLADTVGRCAIAAATEDPRFPPVTAAEFAECDLEVSVLGPTTPVARPDEIIVGRHGLIVEQHGRRGLLLPQVATEYGWDRETFLAHTCMKAGLPRDAWKTGARLFRFEAEVFGEPPAGTRHA
jgi:AmmeMemoRadiSam system protein A